jgi:F0F1-type ATP synthase membrane subunit c/vacuolar-type H+-ATPase subunit K
MTADETNASSPATATPAEVAATEPAETASGYHPQDVSVSLSAIGTVSADTFSATGSAIGVASVDGDAAITASLSPAVLTRGTTTVQQSYVSAIIVGGGAETRVHQAATPLIIGKSVDMTQSGTCALVTGEADVKRSWVGVVISPKTTVSDDSRVMVSTTAALIIGAAVLGGLGLVAAAIVFGVRAAARRHAAAMRPSLSLPHLRHMPDFSAIHLPDLGALAEKVRDLKSGR